MAIRVHYQNVKFKLKGSSEIKRWLMAAIKEEDCVPGSILYYFIDDASQREINSEFLEHHYNTDVITFDYSSKVKVSGEIYIAIETVRKNSLEYNSGFRNEYLRVMVHGLLHLLGFNDKSDSEKLAMREKEDYYLSKFFSDDE